MQNILNHGVMKANMSLKIALLGKLLFVFSVLGYTQTVYVNSSAGDDNSGDGTIGKPYKTFTKGYEKVNYTGKLVLSGVFTWTDSAETGDTEISGFTIAKNITIEGLGSGLAVVQAAVKPGENKSRVFTIPQNSTVTFKNLEIRNGYVTGSNDGGGITIGFYSNITVLNCFIHHNRARQGFAIESLNSNLLITNSTISDNSFNNGTITAGGAVDAQQRDNSSYGITMSNSTVYNNSGALYGGGISTAYGIHYITNCTVVKNTSTLEGGGISVAGGDSSKGNLYIKNSIIANNISITTAIEDYDDSMDGLTFDNGYNIVEFHNSPGLTSTNTISGNQIDLFGKGIFSTPALTKNNSSIGTPTLALVTGSIAINAGNDTANGLVNVLRSDQRGFDRVETYDIGAYEYEANSKTVPTVSTTSISTSDGTSALINGIVIAEGGATVTTRGVIYSETSNNANSKISGIGVNQVSSGSGTGSFTVAISNLLPNTNYSAQTFATNSIGTSYGSVISFTTGMGELTWNGSENSDWGKANNWTPAIIPNARFNVVIPVGLNNYPTITSASVCNNLTIESASTGTGSLIGQNNLTVFGTTTVQHYMPESDKKQLIASPVNESISNFINSNFAVHPANSKEVNLNEIANYENNSSNLNLYTTDRTSESFIPGKGYEIIQTSEGNVIFTGTLHKGDVNISISSPELPGNPWNLVGNPFPSAINANTGTDFLSINADAIHDSYKAIYVRDAASGKYITINNSSPKTYIAPCQAFFIYSAESGSVINFKQNMQTHQTRSNIKSGELLSSSVKLIVEQSKGISTTNILFIENMTTGLDPGFDAGRFTLDDNNFVIYTHLVGDKSNKIDFDIQCLPSENIDYTIPVGLNAPAYTELIFRAEALNLPSEIPVILEDRLKGVYTDLTEAGRFYKVTVSTKSEGTGRFFLHTNKSASEKINPDPGETDFTIIPRPQLNTLNIIGNTENFTEIAVYDMLGRKLLHSLLQRDGASEIEMGDLKSGAYIVCINSSNQKVSRKISWVKN